MSRKGWPPKPGSTVISSSMSISDSRSWYGSTAVPGLTASPARAPAARIARSVRTGACTASAWIVTLLRAGLGVLRRPPVGVFDHQVTVERQRGVLEQRLDDGQAEREVGHEVVVHDIHVQPVRDGGDRGGLVGEPGKVRGQDARRDLNAH